MASRIGLFRSKIALGRYELTAHAKDEMEQDGFTIQDIKDGIYSGRVMVVQRRGRFPRLDVVHGKTSNERGIGLVCRLADSGTLRIITVFAL